MVLITSIAWSDVISHARLIFVFLLMSCGTIGRCSRNPGFHGTPVENHWSRSHQRSQTSAMYSATIW